MRPCSFVVVVMGLKICYSWVKDVFFFFKSEFPLTVESFIFWVKSFFFIKSARDLEQNRRLALASSGHPVEQTQCHMGSYTKDWNEVFPLCPALQNRFLC